MSASASVRPHPAGLAAKVLLTSVHGPYARDDADGSRAVNPMELYHNQVTRVQGVFSLRMFHRSWGLMLIQANLDAPCALLDFPSRDRFVEELRRVPYDVVGIGAIMPNVAKVAAMCSLVREHRPQAKIVVGGHVANMPGLEDRIEADHVVRGDGVRWLQAYLGQEAGAFRHPLITSAFGTRCLGLSAADDPALTAATLIPSAGCPLGCNFCSTSAMFGGKGRSLDFLASADETFDVMAQLEARLGARAFFVMDENFLLRRPRALRLLERMRGADKAWSLYVFSSADSLGRYSMEELVGLGVSWVWIGLEGKDSGYAKLRRADTRRLVEDLQGHGIRVLGSSIIGLPEHDASTVSDAIEHAVSHRTEFHQFMLYTPVPGTPLYEEHRAAGTLLDETECPPADAHGQSRFNYRHPRIPPGAETEMLLRAFRRDFAVNGPSLVRIVRTLLRGRRRYRGHSDLRVRRRFEHEWRELPTTWAGVLWACERWCGPRSAMGASIRPLREEIEAEFGWRARVSARTLGPVIRAAMALEQRRLDRGWTYEPPTFYEVNTAAARLQSPAWARARPGQWVAPARGAPVAAAPVAVDAGEVLLEGGSV